MPRGKDYVEGEPRVDDRDTHSVRSDGSKGARRPKPSDLGSGAAARAARAAEKRNKRQKGRLDDIMGSIRKSRGR